jgi:hypothetical protein
MKQTLDPNTFRQGDVLVIRTDAIPAEALDVTAKKGRVVLHHGEAANHYHAFYDGGVQVYAPKDKTRATHLRVVEAAYLRHEEHDPATLPPGTYKIPVQVEHLDDMEPRVVAD